MARTCRLTPEQLGKLRSAASTGHFNTEGLAAWIERELGVRYSGSGLYKLLPKLGLALLWNGRWYDPASRR